MALRNPVRNLARLREIAATVARHGFGDLFDRARVFEALGFRPRAQPPVPRMSGAARFRLLLTELGPTFVKLGQVLSTRPDVLPAEVIRELATLQDHVPPVPIDKVREVIEKGLGKPVEQLFAHLDPEPLASASIAQVHAARTIDGRDVVVKVQRPGIRDNIRADLDLLYYLATFLESVVEETGISRPTGIVEEFDHYLVKELDFLNEAANVRLFYAKNKDRPYVAIPAVHEDLTCTTVLTLERLRGDKITDLDPQKHDLKQVAHNLIQIIFEHVFVDGVFHGDPHPGNLFVLEGERIGLLDFGVIGRLTHGMQETIVVLCLAVALKDTDTVARLVYKTGVPDDRVNLFQFRNEIAGILERYKDLELQQIRTASLVSELLDLALRYRIRVPQEYALMLRAAIATEGVVRQLYPDLNVLEIAEPYARRLLFGRLTPSSASGLGLRALLQFQSFTSEVPLQLTQLLTDLESGKFSVRMRNDDLPEVARAVRRAASVVLAGLVSAALIVGSFVVLAMHPPQTMAAVPLVAVIGLVSAALILGSALGYWLISGRFRKISLRRWLGRGP